MPGTVEAEEDIFALDLEQAPEKPSHQKRRPSLVDGFNGLRRRMSAVLTHSPIRRLSNPAILSDVDVTSSSIKASFFSPEESAPVQKESRFVKMIPKIFDHFLLDRWLEHSVSDNEFASSFFSHTDDLTFESHPKSFPGASYGGFLQRIQKAQEEASSPVKFDGFKVGSPPQSFNKAPRPRAASAEQVHRVVSETRMHNVFTDLLEFNAVVMPPDKEALQESVRYLKDKYDREDLATLVLAVLSHIYYVLCERNPENAAVPVANIAATVALEVTMLEKIHSKELETDQNFNEKKLIGRRNHLKKAYSLYRTIQVLITKLEEAKLDIHKKLLEKIQKEYERLSIEEDTGETITSKQYLEVTRSEINIDVIIAEFKLQANLIKHAFQHCDKATQTILKEMGLNEILEPILPVPGKDFLTAFHGHRLIKHSPTPSEQLSQPESIALMREAGGAHEKTLTEEQKKKAKAIGYYYGICPN